MEATKDNTPTYCVGDRIQLSPATDRWMRGDRYGEIVAARTRHGITVYSVRMDRTNHVFMCGGSAIQDLA